MPDHIKRIIKNFFSLSGLQIANYVFPFITLPYIVRVIGPEKYGTLNFAQALIGYLNLLILYAYDLSATREISTHRQDQRQVSKIFFTVIGARLFLFAVSSLIFCGLVIGIPKVRGEFLLYLYVFLANLGIALFPTWFYQGIERLSKVAVFNFCIKLIFTLAVFILVRNEHDYTLIPLSTCIGQVLIGGWALYDAVRIGQLQFVRVYFRDVLQSLKNGLKLFLSNVVINLYTTSNTVILGFLATELSVGYFTAASKLLLMVQGIFLYPLSQTMYPFLGKAFHDDRSRGERVLEKILVMVAGVTLLLSVGFLLFSRQILWIVYGHKFDAAITSLRLLSFLPFIIGISNVCGIQGMLNMKMDKEFLRITTAGALLSLPLNFLLVPYFQETGTAIAWLGTEVFISTAMVVLLLKRQIIVLSPKKIKTILTSFRHV
jgi:polysaccharide transporter, PST family